VFVVITGGHELMFCKTTQSLDLAILGTDLGLALAQADNRCGLKRQLEMTDRMTIISRGQQGASETVEVPIVMNKTNEILLEALVRAYNSAAADLSKQK